MFNTLVPSLLQAQNARLVLYVTWLLRGGVTTLLAYTHSIHTIHNYLNFLDHQDSGALYSQLSLSIMIDGNEALGLCTKSSISKQVGQDTMKL